MISRLKRSTTRPEPTPNLWFDGRTKETTEFYCGTFPNSQTTNVRYYNGAGTTTGPTRGGRLRITVEFKLDWQALRRSQWGPDYSFTLAAYS